MTKPFHATAERYKVLAPSYIGDVLHPASTEELEVFVAYDGHPGTALQPTTDEGHRRQREYFGSRRLTAELADVQKRRLTEGAFDPGVLALPAAAPAGLVAIPEGWDRNPKAAGELVLLAADLGAPRTINTAGEASAFIRAEIDRRAASGIG